MGDIVWEGGGEERMCVLALPATNMCGGGKCPHGLLYTLPFNLRDFCGLYLLPMYIICRERGLLLEEEVGRNVLPLSEEES